MRLIASCVFAMLFHYTAMAQDAPQMIRVETGSNLAVWTLPSNPTSGMVVRETPIIFLHGGPGLYTEARRFGEGQPLRNAGFTTIYFDQAGGGQSGRLPAKDYSLDRAVRDLEALRIALGKDKLILWGNSYGASLAAVYADRYPDRVAALLLTAPGMFPGFDGKRDYSQTNRDKVVYSKELNKAVGLIDGKGAAAETKLSQAKAGLLFDELAKTELIEGVVCKGSTIKPPPLPGGGNLYVQRFVSRDVKKLKFAPKPFSARPALIMRGSCDFLPMDSAEKYRVMLGARIAVIDKSGHGLLENRAAYEAALSQFATQDLQAIP
jgi:pimeloyl-ACP methyl ester carboxylesterase